MQNNLAEKEEELEVVEEEQQPEDVSRETSEEDAPAEQEAKSDELEQYSESVQRRISKLTNRFREEERQRQAAIDYAEAVKKQNEELRARIDKLDQSYVGEFGNRVEADAAAAKEAYRKAYEGGDADGMFEAQQRISRIALEQARYEEAKRRNEAASGAACRPAPHRSSVSKNSCNLIQRLKHGRRRTSGSATIRP